jgi:hypothetical protein
MLAGSWACLTGWFLVDLRSTFKGAVVHSGERLICIQEVRGSNPLGSTKFEAKKRLMLTMT